MNTSADTKIVQLDHFGLVAGFTIVIATASFLMASVTA